VDCHWEGSLYEKLNDPKLRHENRIIAVKELVRGLAATSPVVLLIEDVHWLDSCTGEWLTAMTRNIAELPLAILATSRLADDGSKPELPVTKECPITDLDLQPIAGAEFTQAMAKALLSNKLDDETTTLVSDKAGGNPFFTEQLLLHLNETGALEPGADGSLHATVETTRLPGSLGSLVTARIDRLAPDVRETVKHASILGVRFIGRVLRELLKRSGEVTRPVDELLAETEREGILTREVQAAE
jgi:predicted ATPase